MFERFTNQSRAAVVAAQEEARSLDHDYIGPEHFLLGLLRADEGGAIHALTSVGLTLEAARQDVEALTGRGERPSYEHIPFTGPAKKCLELSLREAMQLGHSYIGTGHLLLGVIGEGDNVAVKVLGKLLGADFGTFRARIILDLDDHPEDHDDIPYAARPVPAGLRPVATTLQVPAPSQRAIAALLDTIDERLSAIERQLGMTRGQDGPGAGPRGGTAASPGAGTEASPGAGTEASPGAGTEAGEGENSGPENVVPPS